MTTFFFKGELLLSFEGNVVYPSLLRGEGIIGAAFNLFYKSERVLSFNASHAPPVLAVHDVNCQLLSAEGSRALAAAQLSGSDEEENVELKIAFYVLCKKKFF